MRVFVSQLEHSALALLLVCMRNLVNLPSQYGGNFFFVVTPRNLQPISTTRHPSYSAFFRPAFRNHYERNTTASWPAGLRFQQLLSDLHVTLPTAVPHKQVPPWHLFKATFDFSLTKCGKSTIPAELFRRHFAEVTSKYPDQTHIFTDVSVIQVSTGCSFVFDSLSFIFHLHPFCTIFTAELYALYRALLHLRHWSPGRFLLCTDSLSSLHAL
jgi:hypothetical protein